ncbi:MAG: hypothetical protein FWC79_05095 [Oscillospiraceae bacterium]|nr:hypothetical protein [Oscillospiraceae bacterium]
MVVVGIGGSFAGPKAVQEFVEGPWRNQISDFPVYYVGNDLSSDKLHDLYKILKGKRVCWVIISKSGTTTEPAMSQEVIYDFLVKNFGVANANASMIAITGYSDNSDLYRQAKKNGWKMFQIPEDAGGRYSVMSAVGLLAIAFSGLSIDEFLAGGAEMLQKVQEFGIDNPLVRYVIYRHQQFEAGKPVELISTNDEYISMFIKWVVQVIAETEGKEEKGILPYEILYSRDAHSLEQFLVGGNKIFFETMIHVSPKNQIIMPGNDPEAPMYYLKGKSFEYADKVMMKALKKAHQQSGMAVEDIYDVQKTERDCGALMMFYMCAAAMSAYMYSDTMPPFTQDDVEFYKRFMFQGLGKPGFVA